jgi:enterobacteria phage integrase
MRSPISTRTPSKQRTAYALMLNMGTARVDTHLLTWHQVDDGACYCRHKTGVQVDTDVSDDLAKALEATPRKHVCVITTAYGKPFTVDGFSGFMRDAISKAGLPLDCQPHGLRKTLGRLLADAGEPHTTSWPPSVTPRWRRRNATPAKRIVVAAVNVRL